MKEIVIAGAGGFGREVADYLRQDIEKGAVRGYRLKGIIDDNESAYHHSKIPLSYLGTILEFKPCHTDVVVIAVGNPKVRRSINKRLVEAECKFLSYIHSSCYVATDAKIGTGVIICPNTIINSGAILDDFSVANVFCSIGHGAHVGTFSVLSPYAALNGDAVVGSDCFLGTRATIFPGVYLGNNCIVDSHSYVKNNTCDKQIVTNRGRYLVINNRLI